MALAIVVVETLYGASSSAQNIGNIINNIYNYSNNSNIIHTLKKLDIEASVRILELMLKELNVTNNTKTLETSINLLKKIIIDIENQLAIVYEQMVFNKSLTYFSWARSYSFTTSISKLEELKNQLDNRTRMLIFVLNNTNNLTKETEDKEIDVDISVIG